MRDGGDIRPAAVKDDYTFRPLRALLGVKVACNLEVVGHVETVIQVVHEGTICASANLPGLTVRTEDHHGLPVRCQPIQGAGRDYMVKPFDGIALDVRRATRQCAEWRVHQDGIMLCLRRELGGILLSQIRNAETLEIL